MLLVGVSRVHVSDPEVHARLPVNQNDAPRQHPVLESSQGSTVRMAINGTIAMGRYPARRHQLYYFEEPIYLRQSI